MPDLTRETIAELRRLREMATPGRWSVVPDEDYSRLWAISTTGADVQYIGNAMLKRDAKLLVAIHRHFDPLLAAAERGLGAGDGR